MSAVANITQPPALKDYFLLLSLDRLFMTGLTEYQLIKLCYTCGKIECQALFWREELYPLPYYLLLLLLFFQKVEVVFLLLGLSCVAASK